MHYHRREAVTQIRVGEIPLPGQTCKMFAEHYITIQ